MINLNRLTSAIIWGHRHLYEGDHKRDAVEVINTVAQVKARIEELDDRTDGDPTANLDIDEGNRDAVLDFIDEVRELVAQFEE